MAPRSLGRTIRSVNQSLQSAGRAATVSYTLIGAIVVLAGVGYAIDRWQGTFPWFFLGGLVLGLVVGFYQLARALWPR